MKAAPGDLRKLVEQMMPDVIADLKHLITYPSVAFPGYPEEPVHAMARATVELLKRYGLPDARLIPVPEGYPAVYGEIPAPPGRPTVLLYAHYDVQPANQSDGWAGDPWVPAERNGRIYGRGSADDKAGILIAAATIRAFGGKPPVGIRVLIEGEEETTSHLPDFIRSRPDLVACDLFAILDMSHRTAGEPGLTTQLRGVVSAIVTVRTLDHPVHSGSFGGAAPDALVALIRILATLHTPSGDVAVAGLHTGPVPGADYPEESYRINAGVLPGVGLTGTGPLGTRLWSRPSITVIGINAPSIESSSNSLIPEASAKISMRIAPGADPHRELSILMDHLRSAAPWDVRVGVMALDESPGFVCGSGGPFLGHARDALEAVYGKTPECSGSGATIPLLNTLQSAVPGAEFILWGAGDDAGSHIHGTNESVDAGELERMIEAQSLLLALIGDTTEKKG